MDTEVAEQARQLYRAVNSLIKLCQVRDRNAICCYDISVSQCAALEALGQHGTLTMQTLAAQVHLAVSTVTRLIDQLVEKQLVERYYTARDRRVCCVHLTPAGRQLLQTIQADLVARQQSILLRIPEDVRPHVIWAIEALAEAIGERPALCQSDVTPHLQGA